MNEPLDRFANLSFDSVARYTILEEIGRGGMGVVFLAERGSEGVTENIVLKTILHLSPEREQELRQEANIATRLRHPNIVRTYGLESVPVGRLPIELQQALAGMGKRAETSATAGSASGVYSMTKRRAQHVRRRSAARGRARRAPSARLPEKPRPAPVVDDRNKLFFLLMEYVDGIDLLGLHLEHLRQGTLLPPLLGAYIICRVARALEYAHNSIVHRDVSAENVLIDDQGIPLLTDFGIAVAADSAQKVKAGKLAYLAPEVLADGQADERSDIYALGLTAVLIASGITYQLVPRTGTPQEKYELIRRQAEQGFPALDEVTSDIPPAYARIVARMIHPDPEKRYAQARVLANQLEQEVLYARGLGPTSNSLAAYIDIFESGFEEYDDAQLETLSFLRDEQGRLALERSLSHELYTPLGRRMIEQRAGSSLAQALAQLPAQAQPAAPARGRPMLKVRFGDNCLESVPCAGVIELGRSAQCTLVLADSKVSRKHARVRVTPQGPVLEDTGSGNGVLLDGKKVEMAMLKEGQSFQLGGTQVYYLHEPPVEPPEKVVRIRPEKLPEPAKLDRRLLPLVVSAADRTRLRALWDELARITGLAERSTFVFTQAMTELLGLVAEGEELVKLQILRDRSRLRIYLHPPAGSPRLRETLKLFKQLAGKTDDEPEAGDEFDVDVRAIAATLVRNVFDRIDFYPADDMLLVTKGF